MKKRVEGRETKNSSKVRKNIVNFVIEKTGNVMSVEQRGGGWCGMPE